MKTLSLVAAISLISLIAACGDDAASDTTSGFDIELTPEEVAYCTFADDAAETAERFDSVFEAGLNLGLPMDQMNAQASQRRSEYLEQGMGDMEAIQAVSADLLVDGVFREACKSAYSIYGDG